MNAYKSKNSQYFLRGKDIIHETGIDKENWGRAWVYISVKDLSSIATEKKIMIKDRPVLEAKVAKELIMALRGRKRNTNEVGGRIIALRETTGGYIPYLSGRIIGIGEYEAEIRLLGSGTDLGVDLSGSDLDMPALT